VNKAIRFIPVPSFDVEGTEQWLSDMAEAGYVLTKDGVFACLAFFEKGESRQLRYRLEASPKGTGLFSDNQGEPDPEAVEINARYAWEYVAKRGNFHIYRSDGQGRELNTDPQVQALSLQVLRKNSLLNLFVLILMLIVYPLLAVKSQPLLFVLIMGLPFSVMLFLWSLLLLSNAIHEFTCLNRITRQLKSGIPLTHRGSWRKTRWPFWLRSCLITVLSIAAILGTISKKVNSEAGAVALEDYSDPVPFATMADFAAVPVQKLNYDTIFDDLRFDRIILRHDLLAPVQYDWAEHAAITSESGEAVSGGLYVQYYEMRNEALAQMLFREFLRSEGSAATPMTVQADEAVTYVLEDLHFPALLMRKGNRVMRAYFYQSTETPDAEAWYRVLAEKMK